MRTLKIIIGFIGLALITLSLSLLVSQKALIAPSAPQTQTHATDTEPTASSGTLTFLEGKTTYDCANPSTVTRHILVTTTPPGTKLRLRVTSYVDIYTPQIPERVIFDDLVGDGETIAVTMDETPPSGFGNVHFAATIYFADGSFVPSGSDANVGWPHNCPTPTSTPVVTVTPRPTVSISTPTPVVTAQCVNILIYKNQNGSWVQVSDLRTITPGSTIQIVIAGTTNSGQFDIARMQINDGTWVETTNRNSLGNFYLETTLPSSAQHISVRGQIHHLTLGWL